MPSAKCYVLDTSAILTLKAEEAGAEIVERIVWENGPDKRVFICFITLMECYYVFARSDGVSAARHSYATLRQLPLQVIESSEELGLAAAQIKAKARLSVADAWIAATAQRLQAVLVHKDPEFEQMKNKLTLLPLPYKSRN